MSVSRAAATHLATFLLVTLLLSTCIDPARAWVIQIDDANHRARDIAAFDNGDVAIAGSLLGRHEDLWVRRVRSGDGSTIWEASFDGTAHLFDSGRRVAVDAAGDVIVAGTTASASNIYETAIVKFAGADGDIRWSQTIAQLAEQFSFAVTEGNKVVIAGTRPPAGGIDGTWLATKIAGNGRIAWTYEAGSLPFYGGRLGLAAVSPQGSVYLAGTLDDRHRFLRLDSSSGTAVWEVISTENSEAIYAAYPLGEDLIVRRAGFERIAASDGDVEWTAAAGSDGAVAVDLQGDIGVIGKATFRKLKGSDGQELWRKSAARIGIATAFAAGTDFIVAGAFLGERAFRLEGATGIRLWTIDTLAGLSDPLDEVEITPAGDLVALTALGRVVKIDGGDGESYQSCAGDCDDDGRVTVDEVVRGITRALEGACCDCEALDGNGDGSITVDEVITALDRALRGC